MEEELKIVGNALKSLEANESSVSLGDRPLPRQQGSHVFFSRFSSLTIAPNRGWSYIAEHLSVQVQVFYAMLLCFTFPVTYFRSKILELEEELKVVGNNMKSLEISESEVLCCSIVWLLALSILSLVVWHPLCTRWRVCHGGHLYAAGEWFNQQHTKGLLLAPHRMQSHFKHSANSWKLRQFVKTLHEIVFWSLDNVMGLLLSSSQWPNYIACYSLRNHLSTNLSNRYKSVILMMSFLK